MSDDRIYIRFKGKTLGPLSSEKVRGLIRRGQITRMHELSSDALTWQRAEEFGDFFRSASSPTHAPPASAPTATQTLAESSSPIAGQDADDGVEWYAHFNGDNQGPMNPQTLLTWVNSGDVRRDTLVWRAGLDDWRPAVEVLPEHFSATPNESAAEMGYSSSSIVGADQAAGQLSAEICERFTNHRVWVMILSVLGLVLSGLAVLYFITSMIVGAEAKWMPFGGSRSVVYGLTGLLFCGLSIAGEVYLLSYASSLKLLARHRDRLHLRLAANRLQSFWRYCAIVLVAIVILLVGAAVLLMVMAAAAANAVT
ncbi:DUF4339 domain-containing protein [Allorhodopirellula solitaria]|uniref:GYF domain-containing protein n=1 Tax=Allorhodopirellula solitaria TaxID=2527987 RepID=A0A5C5XUH3_9BACT|nr:DUF4339 domain-containing protein [Allorhodopirellula solitaria]TWT66368.1 hypothetical protein CA85_24620 [Allorhodopirellula solitaria]